LEHFDKALYCDPYHFQVEPSKLVFFNMHAQDLHRSKSKKTFGEKIKLPKEGNVHYIEIYQKGKKQLEERDLYFLISNCVFSLFISQLSF